MVKIAFVFFAIFVFQIQAFAETIRSSDVQALKYRNIGPSRGGRSSAVAGVAGRPFTFYMGNSGGVWKTENAGQSWVNLSDPYFESGSIGAIAVAASDPNVIYVGTGQSTIRGNVALGVGMYKSTDAGKTWNHSGLRKAGQIARVRIHPKNPDLVYVAVIGNPFAENEERGIFRTRDGGKNWEKILFISAKTGFGDLAMDPANPAVLYAAAWTVQRKPWTIISGSSEGGLYKTTDGGDTWKELAGGLPEGVVGKIGVDISPANPDRVWALVEADQGGLFRSDDAGQSWKLLKTDQTRRLYQRAWYYMHIHADPKDQQKVYILNVDQFRSVDGGSTFEVIDVPHGDGHDLWINPEDPRIMVMGTDGGASVTFDEGKNWSTLFNQPTAEIYYVTVDNRFPYRVYGAQQDNTTISIQSRSSAGDITPYQDWRDLGGGESGHIGFAYSNPDIVYAGSYGGEITRLNQITGEFRNIMAYPQMEVGLAPKDLRYRFNWNGPIRVSRHNPKEIYMASQFIHRTTDEGQNWEIISPDLSRNDKTKQEYSGEPITKENTGIEVYSNVLSFEESPVRAGVFWAGTDDGLVHVSDDHGKTWRNVTPPGMPEWGSVNSIEASPHDPARAIITVLKHRLGDFNPYIFVTHDYGKSWKSLAGGKNGIASDVPVRVVREDPAVKDLLYAGAENGMYISADGGKNWNRFQLNLPVVPVTDLKVHQNDLVLSTQGRSFWILDDLTAVHQIVNSKQSKTEPRLLKPRDTHRMVMGGEEGDPPNGVMIFYSLPEDLKQELKLEIADRQGRLVQKFSSETPPAPDPVFPYGFMGRYTGDKLLPKKAGLNRFVWDMRYPVVDFPKGTIVWGFVGGPRVAPGSYTATLSSGDWKQAQTFQVLKDPRSGATQEDLDAQAAFALSIRDRLNHLYHAVRTIRSVREQTRNSAKLLSEIKSAPAIEKSAEELAAKLTAIEEELMQPRNEADQDTENYPTKIDNQFAYVYMHLNYTDSKPTGGQIERIRDLEKELETQLAKLKTVLETDVAAFNQEAEKAGAPGIFVAD